MRPIDADILLKEIEEEIEAEKSYDNYDKGVTAGLRIALRDIKKQPTIEAITREQYHDMTERFFDEFVDNGANEETVAKCMFIGLAFGKLELMLFGENKDGDSK